MADCRPPVLRLTRIPPGCPRIAKSHGLFAHSVRVLYAAAREGGSRPRAPAQRGALQQNRRTRDPRVSEGSRSSSHLLFSFRVQWPDVFRRSRSRRELSLGAWEHGCVVEGLAREWHFAEVPGPGGGFADRLPTGRRQPSPQGWVHGVSANPTPGAGAVSGVPIAGKARSHKARSHTHRVWPSLRTQNRLCSKIIATTAQEQEELHA